MTDIERARERLTQWKRCFEIDDLTKPEVVRSNLNDLYLILTELLAALGES